MSDIKGVIKTEILVTSKSVERDGEKHTLTLTFDETTFKLVNSILYTGTPVWIGLQLVGPSSKEQDDKEG